MLFRSGISSCRSKDFADPQAERVVPGGYHEDTSDASDGSGQSPLAAEKAAKDRERDRQAVKGLYDELAALDEQVSACEAAYDEHYVADRDTYQCRTHLIPPSFLLSLLFS